MLVLATVPLPCFLTCTISSWECEHSIKEKKKELEKAVHSIVPGIDAGYGHGGYFQHAFYRHDTGSLFVGHICTCTCTCTIAKFLSRY